MTTIKGATGVLERDIRSILQSLPGWFVRAARVDHYQVSSDADTVAQIAVYEHGSRRVRVSSMVGGMLLREALAHELGHAVDDNFDHPHYFTSTVDWIRIHRACPYFDMAKDEREPLEYFGRMVGKYFTIGSQALRVTRPNEVTFLESYVFPKLMKEFGG